MVPRCYHSIFLAQLDQLEPQGNHLKPTLELVDSPTNLERAISYFGLSTVTRFSGNDEKIESF